MIYIIRMDGTNCRKIGLAQNVKQRLSGIQVGSPYQLQIEAIFCVALCDVLDVEQTAHFAASEVGTRLSGEWFDIGLDEAIEAVTKAAKAFDARLFTVPQMQAATQRRMERLHGDHLQQCKVEDDERRAKLRVKLGMD